MKYPKIIYVQKEIDNQEEFLLANKDLADMDDGEVAIYEFKKTQKKKTDVSLI